MKNKLISILILFTISTGVSYAGFFRDDSNNNSSASSSSDYGRSSGRETAADYGGFFRAPTDNNPGERPGSGGGIGQEAPIGSGIHTLAICCFIYGLLKIGYKRSER